MEDEKERSSVGSLKRKKETTACHLFLKIK